MGERIPFETKGDTMADDEKNLVDRARELLISELEQAMQTYGPDWVNKEHCAKLIEDLRGKKPTKWLRDRFYGDFLDAILSDFGMRPGDGRYGKIVAELEKGEEETD